MARLLPLLLLLAAAASAQVPPPTKVTLHIKDGQPAQAFAEIGKQAKVLFITNPPDLFQAQLPPVSIDLDAQPFWEAMRQTCTRTGLYPVLLDKQKIVLSKSGRGWMDGVSLVHGQFLIVAVQGARSTSVRFAAPDQQQHELLLQLAVIPEPGLRVLRGSKHPKFDEILDEHNKPLAITMSGADQPVAGGPFGWNLEARFKYGTNANRLARMKGSARYVVQTKAETWEVADVLSAKGATKMVDKRQYRVDELKKLDTKDGEVYALRVAVAVPGGRLDPEAVSTIHPANLEVLDAQGHPMVFKAWSHARERQAGEFVFQFIRAPEGGKPAAGEPAKLLWAIPTATEEVTVPFDFKELPLP